MRRRYVASAIAVGGAAAYILAVRSWQLRWGATGEERAATLAGDDLIANPDLTATRAITVHTSAEQVWPWIAQLGQGRGGFYSYDVLENLVGCDIHSADQIVPQWQDITVGGQVKLHPEVGLDVAVVELGRALVLRGGVPMGAAPPPYDFTWAFVLQEQPEGMTRLLVRERYAYTQRWASLLVEPVAVVAFVMSQRMLRGIRDRAERGGRPTDELGRETTMSNHAGRQRLSVQDAGFLYLEHAGLPQHVAILAVAEGGPLHDPDGRIRVDALRQQLGGRLELVPRLRQRVLCPRVGQGLPLWVDDPGFDLANHVRAVQVPAPGGQRELLGLCDELCLRLLDRARPLWELWLMTGLAQGRVGLVLKLHHSLADGLAAVQLAGLLLDSTANAPNPAAPWQPRPAPSGWALLADNLRWRNAALAAALMRLRHPGRLAAQARVLAGAAQMAAGGRRHQRRSVLRRPVGGRRRLAVARARLAEVKAVARGHGATVNDLLLAAVTGGLRALLVARGTPVEGLILYASVPVALRAGADTAALGNQVGLMVVPLPVGEPDPVQRLQLITRATTERKRRPERLASLRPVGSLTILRALNRYSRHQRIVDLFVTNVPGPKRPLDVLGARLLEVFPVVQVAGNVPLSVAGLSYAGQLNIGIQSDPDGLPDLDVFADGLIRSLEELGAATPSLPG